MSIDWLNFSPTAALAGGLSIGVACTLLLLGIGRIAGISGILSGLLDPAGRDFGWKLSFIAGLVIAPTLLKSFVPAAGVIGAPAASSLDFLVGGLLAGLGARLANGCTSGHGICGLARFSRRSLVAVALFMATAMVVTYVRRHVLGPA